MNNLQTKRVFFSLLSFLLLKNTSLLEPNPLIHVGSVICHTDGSRPARCFIFTVLGDQVRWLLELSSLHEYRSGWSSYHLHHHCLLSPSCLYEGFDHAEIMWSVSLDCVTLIFHRRSCCCAVFCCTLSFTQLRGQLVSLSLLWCRFCFDDDEDVSSSPVSGSEVCY